MFRLENVSKHFDETTAVDAVDLTTQSGGTTVLIGPSGCGKSTTLRLLIGLIEPDAGSVYFDGTSLAELEPTAYRRRMGYVVQHGGLFPHMTARENVSVMPDQLGWKRSRTEARIEELAEMTHLPIEQLESFPAELSGGQRQRVSLMRALMLDPDVLLLDEPLGALDPVIRSDLQEALEGIFDELDKTVVLVTHDMDEAVFFGDQVALMREGRLVQVATPKQLLTEPADEFVTEFIGAQRSALAELEQEV